MIKKLRIKFISLSMGSLLLVLSLIIVSINMVNYRGIVRDADELLGYLADNGGMFPKMKDHKDDSIPKSMSPELPYESRYFSVLLDETGAVILADTGKIAAVDTDMAISYAGTVWQSGKSSGFIQNYRYTLRLTNSGTRIVFLDCGRSLDNVRSFLLVSCGISLIGLVAVFLLILIFSGRIIRPFSENYEKQKRFITDAGHEIKTPLTIIAADADVLGMELSGSEWLEDIQKQTKRLAELTNDLIYLSRMEEEQTQLQMVEFPLSDVVEETAQSFQAPAKTGGKSLAIKVQPMLSLRGDEKAIRQLVSILLDNALKYSPDGGAIELKLERQNRSLRLSVQNTTEPDALPADTAQMFERFYRGDPSRSSQTGGYGIGLSIAKAVAAAHKGKITAASQNGNALTITVSFPI